MYTTVGYSLSTGQEAGRCQHGSNSIISVTISICVSMKSPLIWKRTCVQEKITCKGFQGIIPDISGSGQRVPDLDARVQRRTKRQGRHRDRETENGSAT